LVSSGARVSHSLAQLKWIDVSDRCLCSVAHSVTLPDGHSYERRAIERWLASNNTSPMTGAVLSSTDVVPNHALRNSILEHFQAADRQLSPLKPQTPVPEERAAEEQMVDPDAENSLREAEQHLQALDEYVSTAGTAATPMDPADEIERLFRELDADGSGSLNQTELWRLARQLGSAMTEEDIERAMVEMDPDRSGLVDLDEFRAWWAREPEPEPEPGSESLTRGPRSQSFLDSRAGGASPLRGVTSRLSILSGVLSDLDDEVKQMDWAVFETAWDAVTDGTVLFEEAAELKEIVALYLRKMNCPSLGTIQIRGIERMFDDWMNNTRMSGSAGVSVAKAFDMLEAGAKVAPPNKIACIPLRPFGTSVFAL
jgi:hypothetical protein